ncbi:MAG TPA: SRPBCC domain-containing protein [Bryobacteraceae bacterium]|jgi:activator of HSP90 ATPase|nr:SRPBCC domain-containing protein [Bryobacteraceae bacterium]
MKTIKQTEYFPSATPKQIYDAFLDGKKHSDMTGGKATAEAHVGGKFTAWDGYISGTNLELDEGKRIVQTWTTSEWPEGAEPSHLEWTFIARERGTEVTMVHSHVPDSQTESYRTGWVDYYWTPMKAYFSK